MTNRRKCLTDEQHLKSLGAIEERERIIDELLRENIDLDLIQKVTKTFMSFLIRRKIKILEEQLSTEIEKEIGSI